MAFAPDLVARVKSAIRSELSPRHVPMFTFETHEIPVCAFVVKNKICKSGTDPRISS